MLENKSQVLPQPGCYFWLICDVVVTVDDSGCATGSAARGGARGVPSSLGSVHIQPRLLVTHGRSQAGFRIPGRRAATPAGPAAKSSSCSTPCRGGESRARCGPQGYAGVTPARELVLNMSRCLSCCWGSAPAWHTRPMLPSDCAGTEGTLAMTTLVGLLCCNRIWNKDA